MYSCSDNSTPTAPLAWYPHTHAGSAQLSIARTEKQWKARWGLGTYSSHLEYRVQNGYTGVLYTHTMVCVVH